VKNMSKLRILFGNIALVVYIVTVFLIGRGNMFYYPLLFVSAIVSSYWVQYAIYLVTKGYFGKTKNVSSTGSLNLKNNKFKLLSNWGIYIYEPSGDKDKPVELAFHENVKPMLVFSMIVGIMCLLSPMFIYILLIIPTVPMLFILKQYEIDGRL
jgi:hypothetical protein